VDTATTLTDRRIFVYVDMAKLTDRKTTSLHSPDAGTDYHMEYAIHHTSTHL
jgi:hypothetical protein